MDNFDKNKWQKHEQFIEQEILNSPDKYIWVDKPTQVGLTTSLGKVCLRKGLKLTSFSPTNKIIEDTLGNKVMDGKEYGRIGNNKSMCPKAKEDKFFDIHYSACFEREKLKDLMNTCLNFKIDDKKYCKNYKKGGICKESGGKCDRIKIVGCDKIPGKCKDKLCEYQWVIQNNYSVHGLTYDKFRSLLRKKYDENNEEFLHSMDFIKQQLIKKIFESDFILLDEFPRLIVYKPQGFFVEELEKAFGLINKKIELMISVSNLYKMDVIEGNKEKIKQYLYLYNYLRNFMEGIKNTPLDKEKTVKRTDGSVVPYKYGIYQNPAPLELPDAGTIGYTTMKSLNELKEYVKGLFGLEEKNKESLKTMQLVYMTMTYPEVWIYNKSIKIYNKVSGIKYEEQKLYAFPNIQYPFDELKPYLEEFTKRGGKVVATGMRFPVIDNSIQWKRVAMPDFNNTEAMHLVVCDTKEMSFKKADFDNQGRCITPDHWTLYEEDIKKMILGEAKLFNPLKVIVFAFNKDVYTKLTNWIEDIKNTEPITKNISIADSLCFTYFRSALGSGIRLDYPIKFYIGAADTPEDAYDEGELLYGIPSDFLRILEMSDTFKNSVGRGKDPKGKQPSISFIIGAQKDKVQELFPEKKEIVQVFTQKTIYKLKRFYTYYWFERQNEVTINEMPLFLDAIRQTIDRSLEGKIMTRAYDLQRNWRQKEGFNLSTNDISGLMRKWIKSAPGYIKEIGTRSTAWMVDMNMVKSNDIKFY